MNGAQSLVATLLASGVDTCFANPGTSEMHFVAALDQSEGMRCVLGLQENVVTGMADGYWRMAGKPAATLLHCGPGLANGLANLHNARRARSGIVNIVGDQATWHRPHDPPLSADTEALARTVSAWVRTSNRAADVGRDAAAAVQAACTAPGQIATLVLPSDASWDDGGITADCLGLPQPQPVDASAIDNAARILRSGGPTLLLLAGAAVTGEGQALAWRIAKECGAELMADYMSARVERGRGRLPLERVPYHIDAAIQRLSRYKNVVLVGAKPDYERLASVCQEKTGVCQELRDGAARPNPPQDPRIAAAVIVDPATGTVFTAETLADIKVPIQYWRSTLGGPGVGDGSGTARVATLLPRKSELHVVTTAHYGFLAPCSLELATAIPRICADRRRTLSSRFSLSMMSTTASTIAQASGPPPKVVPRSSVLSCAASGGDSSSAAHGKPAPKALAVVSRSGVTP